jgi:hypothetical protein
MVSQPFARAITGILECGGWASLWIGEGLNNQGGVIDGVAAARKIMPNC